MGRAGELNICSHIVMGLPTSLFYVVCQVCSSKLTHAPSFNKYAHVHPPTHHASQHEHGSRRLWDLTLLVPDLDVGRIPASLVSPASSESTNFAGSGLGEWSDAVLPSECFPLLPPVCALESSPTSALRQIPLFQSVAMCKNIANNTKTSLQYTD